MHVCVYIYIWKYMGMNTYIYTVYFVRENSKLNKSIKTVKWKSKHQVLISKDVHHLVSLWPRPTPFSPGTFQTQQKIWVFFPLIQYLLLCFSFAVFLFTYSGTRVIMCLDLHVSHRLLWLLYALFGWGAILLPGGHAAVFLWHRPLLRLRAPGPHRDRATGSAVFRP